MGGMGQRMIFITQVKIENIYLYVSVVDKLITLMTMRTMHSGFVSQICTVANDMKCATLHV